MTPSAIISSADGVNVAVDDPDAIVREALGLDDNQHVSFDAWAPPEPISVVNGQIILPVIVGTNADLNTYPRDGRNVILVGTPN